MTYSKRQNEYYKEYRKRDPEKHRAYNRKSYLANKESRDARAKAYQRQAKVEVVEHYSRGSNCCACCGVQGIPFLCIDHIAGDGAFERKSGKHKTGSMFYIWLRTQGYPVGFQVLCHNCNQAKGTNDECPHKLLTNTQHHER